MAKEKPWKERSLVEYTRRVLEELEDRYGLEGADVDVDSIAASQENGWSPAEHVANIGRKLGLIDVRAIRMDRS